MLSMLLDSTEPKRRIDWLNKLGWLGTVAQVLGSFLVASGFMRLGYICFLIGAIAWLYIALKRDDVPLYFLNLAFLGANIIGLIHYFGILSCLKRLLLF